VDFAAEMDMVHQTHDDRISWQKSKSVPRLGRILLLVSSVCVVLAGVIYVGGTQSSKERDVESMYHMWLGPNGLPISPRKQRAKLFEFCTTHFVTEAEMRYCYARLLSVGNPSGPVKYAGQPQYDSEQVVSPLFTFAMPAAAPPPPPPAASAPPVTLSQYSYGNNGMEPVSLASFSNSAHRTSPKQDGAAYLAKQQEEQAAAARTQSKLREVEREVASLKDQLHAVAVKTATKQPAVVKPSSVVHAVNSDPPMAVSKATKVDNRPTQDKVANTQAAEAPDSHFKALLKAAKAVANKGVEHPIAAAKPPPSHSSTAAIRSRLSAAAASAAAASSVTGHKSAAAISLPDGQGLNSVFYLPSSAPSSQPWFHKQPALAI